MWKPNTTLCLRLLHFLEVRKLDQLRWKHPLKILTFENSAIRRQIRMTEINHKWALRKFNIGGIIIHRKVAHLRGSTKKYLALLASLGFGYIPLCLMHGYFKMDNISYSIVSDTSLFMSKICVPCRVHGMSLPCSCHIWASLPPPSIWGYPYILH